MLFSSLSTVSIYYNGHSSFVPRRSFFTHWPSIRYFGTFDRKKLNVRQKILDRSKIFSESIQKNFWNVPKFLPDRSKISYGCAVFPSGRSKCRLRCALRVVNRVFVCWKNAPCRCSEHTFGVHVRAKISYRGNFWCPYYVFIACRTCKCPTLSSWF